MTFHRWIVVIAMSFFLQSCASTVTRQQLQLGKGYFINGYYKEAFHQLLPVAACGCPDAEYAVGYMYYYGYSVPRDSESGIFWMSKAAEKGYRPAILALAMIRQGAPTCDFYQRPSLSVRSAKTSLEAAHSPCVPCPTPSAPCHSPCVPCHPSSAPYHSPCATGKESFKSCDAVMQSIPERQMHPVVQEAHVAPCQQFHPVVSEAKLAPYQRAILADKKTLLSQKASAVEAPKPAMQKIHNASAEKAVTVPVNASKSTYALQLYGAYKLDHVKNLQNELHLKESTRILQTQNHGKDWFVLTYGKYASARQAKQAREHLPVAAVDLEPWVRNITELSQV